MQSTEPDPCYAWQKRPDQNPVDHAIAPGHRKPAHAGTTRLFLAAGSLAEQGITQTRLVLLHHGFGDHGFRIQAQRVDAVHNLLR